MQKYFLNGSVCIPFYVILKDCAATIRLMILAHFDDCRLQPCSHQRLQSGDFKILFLLLHSLAGIFLKEHFFHLLLGYTDMQFL